MKLLLPVLVVISVAIAVAAERSLSGTYPKIKGPFTAQAAFALESKPDSGTLAASVRTAKSRKKLRMNMSGVVDPSDTPVPVNVTLKFKSRTETRGKVTATSFLMGYYGAVNTSPANYKQKGRNFTFTLKSGPGGANILGTPLTGAVTYSCKFGRKAFSIVGNGSINTIPPATPVPFTASIIGTSAK